MLSSTFEAFQDELVKIAASLKAMSPEDADKFFGSHAQRISNVEEMAKKFHQERGIPEHVPQGPGTVVARHPKPGPPVPTGVHAAPQVPSGLTQTHIRPAAPHVPPRSAVRSGARLAQGGRKFLKAHGKKGLIGAGILGSEVLVNRLMGGE